MSQVVRDRLVKAFAAQGFAQISNLVIQFATVPLFLHCWGVFLYGEWFMLSTVPSYFALSDLGFASAAGTEMTLRVARGDRAGALKVFQSAWVLVTAISLLVTLAMLGLVHLIPAHHWMNLMLPRAEIIAVVSILACQVFFDLQTGLIGNGYRCDGHFAAGTMIRQAQRLAEFLVLVIVLLCHGGLVALALAVTLTRILGNFLAMLDVRRRSPWLVIGWSHADRETLKSITSPALSFMGFPIGHALSLQGITTVIGMTLGPDMVTFFSTMRTLTRAVWQLLNGITNAIWVELSAAFGSGDIALARSLHRRACQAGFWIAVTFSIALFFAGPFIYRLWTGRALAFEPKLFALLLLVVIISSLWLTSYTMMLAVNRHQQLAVVYVAVTGASLALAYVLTPLMGLQGTALSLLVTDVFMSAYVLPRSLALVHDTLPTFAKFVLTPPFFNPARLNRVLGLHQFYQITRRVNFWGYTDPNRKRLLSAKTPRVFVRELKFDLCRHIFRGQKRPAQVCREHQLTESLLLLWRREFEECGENAFPQKEAFAIEPVKIDSDAGPVDGVHSKSRQPSSALTGSG